MAEAMFIREKYIALSLQEHCPTTAKALNEIDEEFDVDVLLNGREMSVERKIGRSEIISGRSNRNNLDGIGWGLFPGSCERPCVNIYLHILNLPTGKYLA